MSEANSNISGNAVAMPWKAKVAGIVQGWFIGSESGEALASILTGDVYQIIEFQHVKPGKGAAFVRTKIRNVIAGSVVER